jgi:zinc transport system substrate-binding protein
MVYKLFFILLLSLAGCAKSPAPPSDRPTVLVSIEPYRFLVEQISRDTLQVLSIVPPHTNPHTFEPTPKQAASAAKGRIWFQIGESFEEKISLCNPAIKTYDLREGIALISETEGSCSRCSKNHLDRHLWLSPKLALIQAEKIEQVLSSEWPEKQEFFKKNLSQLRSDLLKLDLQISSQLQPLKDQTILVSHPAFGYFCKEYGLHQLSVEYEGKEPRPRHLEKVMEIAKNSHLKIALTLPQYNNKGTLLIAEKLHLETKMIDPYSANYFQTMNELTQTIAQ